MRVSSTRHEKRCRRDRSPDVRPCVLLSLSRCFRSALQRLSSYLAPCLRNLFLLARQILQSGRFQANAKLFGCRLTYGSHSKNTNLLSRLYRCPSREIPCNNRCLRTCRKKSAPEPLIWLPPYWRFV